MARAERGLVDPLVDEGSRCGPCRRRRAGTGRRPLGADGRTVVPVGPPPLHPDVEPLRAVVGTWAGTGEGRYPTIDAFVYLEDVELWSSAKPFVGYQQRTRHPGTGAPMHAESGFVRVVGPAGDDGALPLEAVIAHPTGLAEILAGSFRGTRIDLATVEVARTPTAKEVVGVERTIEVVGDELTYEVRMAAVGQPLQFHLAATLHRVA